MILSEAYPLTIEVVNMGSPRILAVVITYNPDLEVLYSNISALSRQINHIVIYDNASTNADDVCKIARQFENVEVVANEQNDGLPINYNRGLRLCISQGYEWLLTMDQDTVVPDNLIEEYGAAFGMADVAIISPVIQDRKIQTEKDALASIQDDNVWTEISECISSAALNRVSILNELGGFDEKLFIDQVDFDYCKNVTIHGYKIVRMNNCVVHHQIGDGSVVRVLGKDVVISNHSPIRKYYIFRNKVYFARKYHITLLKQPSYYITMCKQFLILFRENEGCKKMSMACKGIIDGLKL